MFLFLLDFLGFCRPHGLISENIRLLGQADKCVFWGTKVCRICLIFSLDRSTLRSSVQIADRAEPIRDLNEKQSIIPSSIFWQRILGVPLTGDSQFTGIDILILHSFFYPALACRVCLRALRPTLSVLHSLHSQYLPSWSRLVKSTTSILPSASRWWSTMKFPHLARTDRVYTLRLAVSSPGCRRYLHCMMVMSLVCRRHTCARLLWTQTSFLFFNKVRYQHDPQVDMSPTPELPVPQLYFAQCLNKNQPQQIPIVDSALEPPSSSARQVTFSHCNQLYSSRYHLGHFPTQYPPVSSRIHATSRDTTFRFIPPSYEQPLSGGSSYEPISSNGTNTDGDHRLNPMGIAGRGEPSISNVVNPSRENRKRTVPVVIACRLWQVFHYVFYR